jgi:hypothetical protein
MLEQSWRAAFTLQITSSCLKSKPTDVFIRVDHSVTKHPPVVSVLPYLSLFFVHSFSPPFCIYSFTKSPYLVLGIPNSSLDTIFISGVPKGVHLLHASVLLAV